MGRISSGNPLFDALCSKEIYSIDLIKDWGYSFFKQYKEISIVYLIGSYAKCCACETSDIDFMVFFKGGDKYHLKNNITISNGKIHWWRGHIDSMIRFNKMVDLFDGYAIKKISPKEYEAFMVNNILIYEAKQTEKEYKKKLDKLQ